MNWSSFLNNQLTLRKKKNLWRKREIIKKNNNTYSIIFNKKKYINFSSNDYLGLSKNSKIIKAWKNGLNQYGAGSSGSSHIIGYSLAHEKLEQELSNWLDYPRALLFISGYAANQSVITTLLNKNDFILADKLSHASLLEAAILSPAKLKRFPHNQLKYLKNKIKQNYNDGKKLVITEGIFSMDGDSAPLNELQSITKKEKAWLLVDDAHGIGVIGKEGKGSCYSQKVKPELLIITFSKAFGISGAALLCNENTADYFLQYARHLIYSTSMPPAQAIALSTALQEIRKSEKLRIKLQKNINYFRKLANYYNFPLLNSYSAIQPLIVGSNNYCLKLSNFLRQKGFWVQPIRPPTVPNGSARLRITLMASHKLTDITKLLETLKKFFNQYSNENK